MSWRNRLEVAVYRRLKPLTGERTQRALPGEVQATVPEQRPRGVQILRSKAATVAVGVLLVGGGAISGGYIEDQRHEAELASMDAAEEEQIREEMEWDANHNVCMAEAQARAAPDEGVFDVLGDPQLDKCYAEQQLRVADIKAQAQ